MQTKFLFGLSLLLCAIVSTSCVRKSSNAHHNNPHHKCGPCNRRKSIGALHKKSARVIYVFNYLPQTIHLEVAGDPTCPGMKYSGTIEEKGMKILQLPRGWEGKIWAHLGKGRIASVAEFKLDIGKKHDLYHVNLASGYNFPVMIKPTQNSCKEVGCKGNFVKGCEQLTNYGACIGDPEGRPGTPYADHCSQICPRAFCFKSDVTKIASCRNSDYAVTIG